MDKEAVATHAHENCIICGSANPYSLGLEFYAVDDSSVETCFSGSETLQGYTGLLHGGVTSALLDAAMVHCLFHKGVRAVTADLHVRFLEQIDCRRELKIKAWLISSRFGLHKLKAEMIQDNKIAARASAKFMETESS